MNIVRIILGVIGGYVAMAALIMGWAFFIVPAIYPELAPVNGEYPNAPLDHPGFKVEVPFNFVAGGLGGLVCGLVTGRGRRVGAMVMAVLMILLSIPALFYTDVKPLWATILAPVLGIAGIALVVAAMDRKAAPPIQA